MAPTGIRTWGISSWICIKYYVEMQRWGIMEMLGDLPLEKKDFHIKVYDVFWFDAWFACSVCQKIMHLEVVVVLHLNILQIKDSFHILLSLWFIQKSFIVWLGNDFTPNRAQAITWANNDWIQWSWNVSRHMADRKNAWQNFVILYRNV